MQREGISIRDVTEFIIINGEGLYRPGTYLELYKALIKHRDYDTLEILTDEKGIKAVCRYNHIAPWVIFVIDTIIRKDARGIKTLQELIAKAEKTDIKYLTFDRGIKYPTRKRRLIKVEDILRRR